MEKIKNVFTGVLVGLLLIIIGAVLLFWNEKNNVKNIKDVDEMREVVINVDCEEINLENDGKLINTSGKLDKLGNKAQDEDFGIIVDTALLERKVEMFQWKESSSTDSNNKTTYSYKKEWSEDIINSNLFKETTYINPSNMPYGNKTSAILNAKLGKYELDGSQINKLPLNAEYQDFSLAVLPNGYLTSEETDKSYITNSIDLTKPEIGDIRISYKYNNSENITVLAQQKGNNLINYITEKGTEINKVSDGIKTATEMINDIEKTNNLLKWGIRIGGTIAIIVGIMLLLGPISTLASFVPILGGIVGATIAFVSILLGTIISLIVISAAWIIYRPLLGIGLLLISIILIYLTIKYIKNKKQL